MIKKLLTPVLIGSLAAAECLPGHDPREQPHTHPGEQEYPQPVGTFAVAGIFVASTGSTHTGAPWVPRDLS